MIHHHDLIQQFDLDTGDIRGGKRLERRLSELKGCFKDAAACEHAVRGDNPLVYTVSSIDFANGDGDLHYGLGVIYPGSIGGEYFLTKGHLHSWRAAAEVYIGLRGEGAMLLEDELTGESRLCPLGENLVVYVPGDTAHRTVNTGSKPLVYLGVYPAKAGHDYEAIAQRNFRKIVVARDGKPVMIDR